MGTGGKRWMGFLLLWICHALFLWMFLAAEGLEQMAEAGSLWSTQQEDPRPAAYRFAAEWRHGMAGGWPIYMPGFFAVAAVTWLWANGKSPRRLLGEITVVAFCGLAAAAVLASLGTPQIVSAFERHSGFVAQGATLGFTYHGVLQGLLTLATWSVFVLASKRALERKTWRPFWLPAILTVVLVLARPVTLDDLAWLWLMRALGGDPVAIVSLLLAPALGTFLAVWSGWKPSFIGSTST